MSPLCEHLTEAILNAALEVSTQVVPPKMKNQATGEHIYMKDAECGIELETIDVACQKHIDSVTVETCIEAGDGNGCLKEVTHTETQVGVQMYDVSCTAMTVPSDALLQIHSLKVETFDIRQDLQKTAIQTMKEIQDRGRNTLKRIVRIWNEHASRYFMLKRETGYRNAIRGLEEASESAAKQHQEDYKKIQDELSRCQGQLRVAMMIHKTVSTVNEIQANAVESVMFRHLLHGWRYSDMDSPKS